MSAGEESHQYDPLTELGRVFQKFKRAAVTKSETQQEKPTVSESRSNISSAPEALSSASRDRNQASISWPPQQNDVEDVPDETPGRLSYPPPLSSPKVPVPSSESHQSSRTDGVHSLGNRNLRARSLQAYEEIIIGAEGFDGCQTPVKSLPPTVAPPIPKRRTAKIPVPSSGSHQISRTDGVHSLENRNPRARSLQAYEEIIIGAEGFDGCQTPVKSPPPTVAPPIPKRRTAKGMETEANHNETPQLEARRGSQTNNVSTLQSPLKATESSDQITVTCAEGDLNTETHSESKSGDRTTDIHEEPEQTLGSKPDNSAAAVTVTPSAVNRPPAISPRVPRGLTKDQQKRREIIGQIIRSEKSYMESLERVIKVYEKPVLECIPVAESRLKSVFATIKEILGHHKKFQIELIKSWKVWDREEKIGDIFTDSFSKTVVVKAYTVYVNSYAFAVDEMESLRKSRKALDAELKKQEASSADITDKLHFSGMMIKPVQRFPQFLMFLQDLIKHTLESHHDRRALQQALAVLKDVACNLNENRKQSEQKILAQKIVQQMKRQHMWACRNLDQDPNRKLLRKDAVEQQFGELGNMKRKERQLILMNDLLLCCKAIYKGASGGRTLVRLEMKWMANLCDLELQNTAAEPDSKNMTGVAQTQSRSQGLVTTLLRSARADQVQTDEPSGDWEYMRNDERLRPDDSCSITLINMARSDNTLYVFQTRTAALKQSWCVDFITAKLALDTNNIPAWGQTADSCLIDADVTPAYFMKYMSVDVPRHFTEIRCAVSVFMNPETSPNGVGVQHLWVCSSTAHRGQVCVLSTQNTKPSLVESFRACECDTMAIELVPGSGEETIPAELLFAENTVWIATANGELLVFPVINAGASHHRKPLSVIRTLAVIVTMKYTDNRLFCGFATGSAVVYFRDEVGVWKAANRKLDFGNSQVQIHFVLEKDLWLTCGNGLFVLDIYSVQKTATHVLSGKNEPHIDHVVNSGAGIVVSFRRSPVIKLFHMKSMECLQEINVEKVLSEIGTEMLWSLDVSNEIMAVTCLAISEGLLWIGTSIGAVFTLPLLGLSDGVPMYRGQPNISLHAHRRSVKFLMAMYSSPSRGSLEREKSELKVYEARRKIDPPSVVASDTKALKRRSWEVYEKLDPQPGDMASVLRSKSDGEKVEYYGVSSSSGKSSQTSQESLRQDESTVSSKPNSDDEEMEEQVYGNLSDLVLEGDWEINASILSEYLPSEGFPRGRTTEHESSGNAMIVLSGGDGYYNLIPSESQLQTEEACVLFWLYKCQHAPHR